MIYKYCMYINLKLSLSGNYTYIIYLKAIFDKNNILIFKISFEYNIECIIIPN